MPSTVPKMTHFSVPAVSLAYFFFLGFWLYLCHRSRKFLHRIHGLMSWILLVRALTSLLDTVSRPRNWEDHLIQSIRLTLVFALALLLIKAAQSFLRPLTQSRAKKVMTALIGVQVTANAALGEMERMTRDPAGWDMMGFLIVHVLGGFSVLTCIVWHMVQSKEALKSEKKKTAGRRAADRAMLFTQLYVGVVGFSYFTKFWSSFSRAIVQRYDQKMAGAVAAVEETASLVGCAVLFYCLRPEAVKRIECFVADDEEDEGAVVDGGSFP